MLGEFGPTVSPPDILADEIQESPADAAVVFGSAIARTRDFVLLVGILD